MFRKVSVVVLVLCAALAAGWLAMRRADIPYAELEPEYVSEASQFLTLPNGLKVHFKDEGPEGAPAILLLHGFASSLDTWDGWADSLTDDYRVVRVDLPGHGLTRVLQTTNLTTGGMVRFVSDMAGQLELEEFVLAGSSMGGHVAWEYAVEHPEALSGLVLVDAAGLPDGIGIEHERPALFDTLSNPMVAPFLRSLNPRPFVKSGMESAFSDQSFVTDDLIDQYADYSRAPGHRGALIELASRDDLTNEEAEEQLSALSLPVLVMHGADDQIVPLAHSETFIEFIPNAELIVYDGIGHLPQEEAMAASVSDLRAFLDGVFAEAENPQPEATGSEFELAE